MSFFQPVEIVTTEMYSTLWAYILCYFSVKEVAMMHQDDKTKKFRKTFLCKVLCKQVEAGQTAQETSGFMGTKRVKKWPNSLTAT